MADGSVTPASTDTDKPVYAPLMIDQEWYLDLRLPDADEHIGDADMFVRISERLSQMASATLRVAMMRGDDDSDLKNTFHDAVHGAAILQHLSQAATAMARKLLKEKARG